MNINPRHQGLINTAIWVCLYGGLLSIVFALALAASDRWLACLLGAAGSLATVLGIGLIYIRSRMK